MILRAIIHVKLIKLISVLISLLSSEPITGEGRWPAEPPFVAPPEEEIGANLGEAVVTVVGSLAIAFAVHVGYWALKRGWAWRKLYANLIHYSRYWRRE